MTIYGTPGGTPLNTTPFQGTAPGNAPQATIQPLNPGVGMFPPNSNNASGDSVLASASRAAIPANVFVNNEGVGNSISLTGALSTGSDGGNQQSAASGIPFGSAVGGGQAGVGGQGGANMNNDPGRVGDVQLGAQANPSNLTFQAGAGILTLANLVAGTTYTNGTYNNVPLTGGHGSGAQATIVVAGTVVSTVTLTAPGFGYQAGDVLSAAAANIGGTGSGFAITVQSVSAPVFAG